VLVNSRLSRRIPALLAVVAVLFSCTTSQTPAGSGAPAGAKDTLTVATTADPGTTAVGLNRPTNIVGRRLAVTLFDGLFQYSYDDPANPLKVVPGLATSWEISPDGLKYTFKLRKGVQFHDGTTFDAEAVRFNFRMLLDPTFEFYDKTGGTSAQAAVSATVVDSYRVVDDSTFEMQLKRPFAALLDEWSQPGIAPTWIVSPAAVKQYGAAGIATHPVGTGPFKLESYKPGESLVFSRNDSYFRGPAAVKTMIWRIMTDPAARAVALESGQVDIAEDIGVQYKDQWKSRTDLTVQATTAPNGYACWLNAQTGPVSKPEFRRALTLAINRKQINDIVMRGLANTPNGYFAPGLPAYSQDDPPLVYDAKAAAAAIDQLGLKGTKITYETTTALGDPATWEVFNRSLTEAGLSPVQRTVDLATWLGDYQRLSAANLDMACGLMGSDSMLQIYTLLRAGKWPTNPAVDAAYDKLLTTSRTQDEYVTNLKAVNRLITKETVALFIVTTPRVNGMSAKVDWRATPTYVHSLYTARFK
jgi:peptide/nickel transport system substrate-binding protein